MLHKKVSSLRTFVGKKPLRQNLPSLSFNVSGMIRCSVLQVVVCWGPPWYMLMVPAICLWYQGENDMPPKQVALMRARPGCCTRLLPRRLESGRKTTNSRTSMPQIYGDNAGR